MRHLLRSAIAILAALAAGATLPAAEPGALSVRRDDTKVIVSAGDRPLLRYRYAGVPFKPYVDQFFTPGGVSFLRDAPSDHLHHHALMYAVWVNGVNFWEERPGCGRQLHREFTSMTTSAKDSTAKAAWTERLDWADADGRTLAREQRAFEVYRDAGLRASLLTWRTRLEPAEGLSSIALTGTDYDGLGIRFVTSMDKVGQFLVAAGSPEDAKRRQVQSAWIGYAAPAPEGPVTAALFDAPGNLRHPAGMFRMTNPFAYMTATVGLRTDQPLEVRAGSPLELCYGVAVLDGQATAAQLEALYRRWTSLW